MSHSKSCAQAPISCATLLISESTLVLSQTSSTSEDRPVLLAKGLAEGTQEGALLDAFRFYGPVREIRLVRDRSTRDSRGFAFVEFHSLEAAHAAVRSPHARPIMASHWHVAIPRYYWHSTPLLSLCVQVDASNSGVPLIIDGATARVAFAKEVRAGKNSMEARDSSAGSNSGFEMAHRMASEHQGPKRVGFGIPNGFLPDHATGYYYSQLSGYYYDAATKLYYHPTTRLWYESDPITGLLKEHISEVQQAVINAANAANIAAKTAAADAARAASLAAQKEDAVKLAEAAPLLESHSKVVLGLGKNKKGVARVSKTVGVFQQVQRTCRLGLPAWHQRGAGWASSDSAKVPFFICTGGHRGGEPSYAGRDGDQAEDRKRCKGHARLGAPDL